MKYNIFSILLLALCALLFLDTVIVIGSAEVMDVDELCADVKEGESDPELVELCAAAAAEEEENAVQEAESIPEIAPAKRKNEFVRFGKRKNEFVRFGKRKNEFVRFGKRKNEFVRFGKRACQNEMLVIP